MATYEEWYKQWEKSPWKDEWSQADLDLAKRYPEFGLAGLNYKNDWHNAATPEQQALAHANMEEARSYWGSYTGSPDGSGGSIMPTTAAQNAARDKVTGWSESSPYVAAVKAAMGQQADWSNGARSQQVEGVRNQLGNYQQGELPQAITRQLASLGDFGDFQYDREPDYQAALDRVVNPGAFSYDYKTDPAYQAYAKQYAREGRRASEDTMGQYAALTGGRPSTAAVTAGQQAGNYYASQLADKIPELYNQAYQRYLNEFTRQLQGYNALQADRAMRYGEYGDRYNRESNYLAQLQGQDATEYARLVNQLTDLENADKTEYQRLLDTISMNQGMDDNLYGRALQSYNLTAAEDEAARARVQNEEQTAYQRSEYADEKQYAREQTAKEWDYKMSQDAIERARIEKSDAMAEAEWRAKYGDYSGLRALGIDVDAWLAEQAAVQASSRTSPSTTKNKGTGRGSGLFDLPASDSPDYLEAINNAIQNGYKPDASIAVLAANGVSQEDILNSRQMAINNANNGGVRNAAGSNAVEGEPTVSNKHSDSWVTIQGMSGRYSWQELLLMVEDGRVEEVYDPKTNTYTYRKAR